MRWERLRELVMRLVRRVWEPLKHPIEYLCLRVLVCCVQALSPRMCTRGAHLLATFVHYCLPRRKTRYAVACDNIRLAFGDKFNDAQVDRLIFRMWVHLFRLCAEVILLPRKLCDSTT